MAALDDTVPACSHIPIASRSAPPHVPIQAPCAGTAQPPGQAVIESVVAQVFDVDIRLLRRTTRGPAHVALARQVAMYIAHAGCGLNMSDAGEMFARDRTTVAHACGVVEDRRDDPVFDRTMELLEGVVAALIDRAVGAAEVRQ